MNCHLQVAIFMTALFVFTTFAVKGQSEEKQPTLDFSKRKIEVPLRSLVAPKEKSSEKSVSNKSTNDTKFKNPKVRPGIVYWRKNFQAAQKRSKITGKPILLFQMIGHLDDRFC